MLKKMPDLSKYRHSKANALTFTKAWANPCFGGSVLNAVGTKTKPKSRKNQLQEHITKSTINGLYGGGYYVIQKVQQFEDNESWFMDIYILVESVENFEHMGKLKKIQDDYNNRLKPKKTDLKNIQHPPKPLKFDEIKESLNGFARIVYYKSSTTDPSPEYCQIESMTEGQIK